MSGAHSAHGIAMSQTHSLPQHKDHTTFVPFGPIIRVTPPYMATKGCVAMDIPLVARPVANHAVRSHLRRAQFDPPTYYLRFPESPRSRFLYFAASFSLLIRPCLVLFEPHRGLLQKPPRSVVSFCSLVVVPVSGYISIVSPAIQRLSTSFLRLMPLG